MNNKVGTEVSEDSKSEKTPTASPSISVLAAITASLERDKETKGHPFKYQVGNTWNLKNNVSTEFVEQIQKKFRRKNKFHSYFSGLPSNKTPDGLKKLISGDIALDDLAVELIKILTITANESESRNLVGGNIVFMHYKTFGDYEDHGRLMIVMVDKKGAFEFEEGTLQPRRLQPIDTDALRQAAMFDLTLFLEIHPKKEGSAYLHFIDGKSKAEFFKTALGCDIKVTNQQSVNNVFEAIKKFSNENKLGPAFLKKVTEKVYEHIEKNLGKQVSLVEIQQVIDKGLPAGHKLTATFAKYANENGFQINSVFEATRQALEKSISIKITDFNSNYSVSVKAASIGYAGSNKPVQVDDELTYLKIPLSEADREKIKASIGDHESSDEDSN
ncbi:nucleoid-associated protein [Pseudomonas sp. PA27(2017)]|uniref:nucleoid-associated protein n=1 Tax=Pseudomonas sp. PA27(2017) TaxID=1932112 RepID=UPI0009679B8A|nr:nucleoid-associated protein [Pseudomonas sp. PA27(2017)]OLU34916.1 hypothetical protein BVH06_04660 [Pseudomonas sp. PA27(2017)]OLU36077.1 hypothetical protein BVH06_00010 [Pseudomonas sp. PA27(2017)]